MKTIINREMDSTGGGGDSVKSKLHKALDKSAIEAGYNKGFYGVLALSRASEVMEYSALSVIEEAIKELNLVPCIHPDWKRRFTPEGSYCEMCCKQLGYYIERS